MTGDVLVAVIGALGGGVISLLASLLTLRSTHRAERERWLDDRDWEYATTLSAARREAYSKLLACQNAIIMSAAAVRDSPRSGESLTSMPADQAAVYQSLQDAYAIALLLAGPATQKRISDVQQELDQMVWDSWEGKSPDLSDELFADQLESMKLDAIELNAYRSRPANKAGEPPLTSGPPAPGGNTQERGGR